MANKDFQLKNLIEQGKMLRPSKLKITFREIDDTDPASVSVYGIGRNTAAPTLLNATAAAVDLTGNANELESSMIIELNHNYVITDVVVRIHDIEKLARLHNMVLIVRPDELDTEEYELTI